MAQTQEEALKKLSEIARQQSESFNQEMLRRHFALLHDNTPIHVHSPEKQNKPMLSKFNEQKMEQLQKQTQGILFQYQEYPPDLLEPHDEKKGTWFLHEDPKSGKLNMAYVSKYCMRARFLALTQDYNWVEVETNRSHVPLNVLKITPELTLSVECIAKLFEKVAEMTDSLCLPEKLLRPTTAKEASQFSLFKGFSEEELASQNKKIKENIKRK